MGDDDLKRFGANWFKRQKDYEDYLGRVEKEVNDEEDDDDFSPAPKQPKDNVVGRQNAAAEDIVNQILKSIDKKAAGEIRNIIAREPNKLQALQKELAKRNIKVGESIRRIKEQILAELLELTTEFVKLNDGSFVQIQYRPMLNRQPMPGSVQISVADPRVIPNITTVRPLASAGAWQQDAINKAASSGQLKQKQSGQGVAEGIRVVDQDYDLDQIILTLDIEGRRASFTYTDYDENFENAERKDVFDQLQEKSWYKGLDHPTKMEILDAAYKAIRGEEPSEYKPTVGDEPLDIDEGVSEGDLEEDWRKKLAAAGMAGMMGLSGAAGAADRVPDTAKEPIIATVVIDGEARRLDLTPKGFDDVKEAERFLKKFLADRGIKDWQAKIERSKPGTGKYERLSISGMGGLESIQSRQGVAEGSLNELSTGTLKSYREKSNREVNAFKEKEKSDQLSDKDFFKKQDRLMGITGASKRIDKRGITGVGEDSLNELFEPQTEYYELSNGDIIQASYRPMPNQTAMPGTVKIKHVDPALMPKGSSFDSTGSIQRWDKAPDGVKQEIEKFVGQANKVSHVTEAEYQGRKVPLGKKMAGDVKKSKVYVRKPNGKVVKVNFGDKNMTIKKSNPARRKSFRARHNCANPGPRWKARYWSCRSW